MQEKKSTDGKNKKSRFIPITMLASPAISVLSLFLKNWKIGIFVLLISFIGYQNYMPLEVLKPIGFRTIPGILQDVAEDKKQLDDITEQLVQCKLDKEKLKTAIEVTNTEIDKWVSISQKLRANQDKLNTQLIELKKKSDADLANILQNPIPTTCDDAIGLLKNAVINGDLSWK